MNGTYLFRTEMDIRVSDINYGGHLGNDRYLSFLHEARIRYLKQLEFSEMNIGDNASLIMSESHLKYKAQAFLGDVLEVGVRVSEISAISFLMQYQIMRKNDNKVVATGWTKMAAFDYHKMRVIKIPEKFRLKVQAFEDIN